MELHKHWRGLIRPRSLQVEEESLTDRYGKFIAEPLERGFGVSIGNALRRVLLSSIRGAAVVALRIEGVQHEFSTVPNVLEDVTEIVLNLKALNIKLNVEGPKVIRRRFIGEMEVKSGDLFPGPEVVALDPEQHIATVGQGGVLDMEVVVQDGYGYQEAERLKDPNAPIGTIFLDAIFTPIRKVNFRVMNARVGERTDYDRLVLEVWTNGAISPKDAVGVAAKILKEQLRVFIHFDEGEEPVEAVAGVRPATPGAAAAELGAGPPGAQLDVLYRTVDELELSARAQNCLQAVGIRYIGELVEKTEAELLKAKNFGRKSLKEIKDALAELNLSLGMRIEGFDPSKAPH